MKRNLCFLATVIGCYLLQSTVFQYLQLAHIAPNLLLIVVVAIAYIRGKNEAMFYGLLCGLLMDCQHSSIIGIYAFLYILIGYLAGCCNKLYYHDDYTIPIALVAIGDIIFNILFYVISFLLRNRTDFFYYFRRIIIPETVYTVLISIFLYKLIHYFVTNIENISRKES
ncbi:MAG: rod shape-determining protein MreD [bacterium]|nr:rod shape-determining protein MreD [bacterium]